MEMRERDLKKQCRLIFAEALQSVDAGAAVRKAVKFSANSQLAIFGENYELQKKRTPIYSIALGKAARPMALALDEILNDKLVAGVVSGVLPKELSSENAGEKSSGLSSKWRVFAGGHPLPNRASLAAADSCFELLDEANDTKSIVIFLISGGGSAMLESPINDSISLADLREANRILVSCGASIAEINQIRRRFSRVKGGGLASAAPNAAQISLIVSDTEIGDEKSVASGPTFDGETVDVNEINSIIERLNLNEKLPESIIRSIIQKPFEKTEKPKNIHRRHVLLDNQSAINAAADYAEKRGFVVKIADDISQQNVEKGCAELVKRTNEMLGEINENEIACLISGGEFSCPVRGNGIGGRNAETVLRMALMAGETGVVKAAEFAFLSAGTDGIDGNSQSAGAVCNFSTPSQARALELDAREHLENSDADTFFQALSDSVVTGATGTNVRDVRVMLARK